MVGDFMEKEIKFLEAENIINSDNDGVTVIPGIVKHESPKINLKTIDEKLNAIMKALNIKEVNNGKTN